MNRENGADPREERSPFAGPALLQLLALGLFCALSLRLWHLQIHKGEQLAARAVDNRSRQEPIYAQRGYVVDREGRLLAQNEPSYALAVIREDVKDMPALLAQVSAWTGLTAEQLKEAFDRGRRRVKPWEPLVIVPYIPFDLVARVEAQSVYWPGLEVVVRPRRTYPAGPVMAHILGYVAEVSEEDLEKDEDLRPGDAVGKNGVELSLERRLRGHKGRRLLEVDAAGRALSQRVSEDPQSGENVALSIDLELQALGMKLLQGQRGAIVAMEPYTGQVLAMVSQPSYDNNVFVKGVPADVWKALNADEGKPLQNRAVHSTYPPGSVWKILMTAAGLHTNQLRPGDRAFCPGGYRLGERVFRCWKKSGHGTVDLNQALVQSCDVFFYQLGERMGPDRIHDYALRAGFGRPTGIDIPHEKGGLAPSREWKMRRFGEKWVAGETLNMSIGQGYTLTTPLQVARFISSLVNGGTLHKPGLALNDPPEEIGKLPLSRANIDFILQAMANTVEDERGTAKRMRIPGARLGGKTGTAQVVRLFAEFEDKKTKEVPYKYRDHAWIASWGVKDGRALVVVCMVEHGGHGGEAAVPVAKAVYDHYFGVAKRGQDEVVREVQKELNEETGLIVPPQLAPGSPPAPSPARPAPPPAPPQKSEKKPEKKADKPKADKPKNAGGPNGN